MKVIRTRTHSAIFDAGMDRRAFMGRLGLVAGAGAMAYAAPGVFSLSPAQAGEMVAAAAKPLGKPVVSVFMGMPWVDMTGQAKPYVPPESYHLSADLTLGEDFGNYHYYV